MAWLFVQSMLRLADRPCNICGRLRTYRRHDNDDDDVGGEGEVLGETEGAVRDCAMCVRERERPQVPVRAGV